MPRRNSYQNDAPKVVMAVHDHDVLSGRGVNIAHHPGNERFRALVTSRADANYCSNYSATEKRAVAEEIIQHISSLNPPGRFLRREGSGRNSRGLAGPWFELKPKEIAKKTTQALRDCNRQDRTGYASGVAVPQDVVASAKERAESGLSIRQQAQRATLALYGQTSLPTASTSMETAASIQHLQAHMASALEQQTAAANNTDAARLGQKRTHQGMQQQQTHPSLPAVNGQISPSIENAAEWLKKQRTDDGIANSLRQQPESLAATVASMVAQSYQQQLPEQQQQQQQQQQLAFAVPAPPTPVTPSNSAEIIMSPAPAPLPAQPSYQQQPPLQTRASFQLQEEQQLRQQDEEGFKPLGGGVNATRLRYGAQFASIAPAPALLIAPAPIAIAFAPIAPAPSPLDASGNPTGGVSEEFMAAMASATSDLDFTPSPPHQGGNSPTLKSMALAAAGALDPSQFESAVDEQLPLGTGTDPFATNPRLDECQTQPPTAQYQQFADAEEADQASQADADAILDATAAAAATPNDYVALLN